MLLPKDISSTDIRHCMIALGKQLSHITSRIFDNPLGFISAGRFDQQVTTQFHYDGGPEVSFLMLGYEPSSIESELYLADVSKAADDQGVDLDKFLEEHNPMFENNEEALATYTSMVPIIPDRAHIVIINNSKCSDLSCSQKGIMHKGVIHPAGDEDTTSYRIVNSLMLSPEGGPLTEDELDTFIITDNLSE